MAAISGLEVETLRDAEEEAKLAAAEAEPATLEATEAEPRDEKGPWRRSPLFFSPRFFSLPAYGPLPAFFPPRFFSYARRFSTFDEEI